MNTFKLFVLGLAFGICNSLWLHAQQAKPHAATLTNELEAHLHKKMQIQVDAWNRGDIEAFMQPYWKDEKLTFSSGGKTQRGWQKTFQQYRTKYPDRATMGTLHFSELESQELGPDSVLTLGAWRLDREQPLGGNFTLIWKRIDGEWVIIHDHSSARIP